MLNRYPFLLHTFLDQHHLYDLILFQSAPEDIGYKLCTAEQLNSSSPSILFTKKDWINECRESFVQMILNRAYDLKNHQELHHHDHSDHDQHNHQDHHHHHDHHDHHDHHEGLPVKLNSTKTTTHDS